MKLLLSHRRDDHYALEADCFLRSIIYDRKQPSRIKWIMLDLRIQTLMKWIIDSRKEDNF